MPQSATARRARARRGVTDEEATPKVDLLCLATHRRFSDKASIWPGGRREQSGGLGPTKQCRQMGASSENLSWSEGAGWWRTAPPHPDVTRAGLSA